MSGVARAGGSMMGRVVAAGAIPVAQISHKPLKDFNASLNDLSRFMRGKDPSGAYNVKIGQQGRDTLEHLKTFLQKNEEKLRPEEHTALNGLINNIQKNAEAAGFTEFANTLPQVRAASPASAPPAGGQGQPTGGGATNNTLALKPPSSPTPTINTSAPPSPSQQPSRAEVAAMIDSAASYSAALSEEDRRKLGKEPVPEGWLNQLSNVPGIGKPKSLGELLSNLWGSGDEGAQIAKSLLKQMLGLSAPAATTPPAAPEEARAPDTKVTPGAPSPEEIAAGGTPQYGDDGLSLIPGDVGNQ